MTTPRDSSGVGDIWTMDYPFEYWRNRIQKLNQGNPHDALDALFIHSHLADVFTTTLAARMHRPNFPWYVIKNELPTYEIHDTIDVLEETVDGESRYFVEKLLSKPDDFVIVNLPDDVAENVNYKTAFVNQFLGCPSNFDEDGKTIDPIYDPDAYMAICNAVINYWKATTDYLNDFKHGFRVIPFHWERLEWLYENNLITADIEIGEVRENYDEFDSDWTFDFWRMEVKDDTSVGTPVKLEVHTADVEQCIAFSNLTLKLIYNLFDGEQKQLIEDDVLQLFQSETVPQGAQQNLIHQQYTFETRFYENNTSS